MRINTEAYPLAAARLTPVFKVAFIGAQIACKLDYSQLCRHLVLFAKAPHGCWLFLSLAKLLKLSVFQHQRF